MCSGTILYECCSVLDINSAVVMLHVLASRSSLGNHSGQLTTSALPGVRASHQSLPIWYKFAPCNCLYTQGSAYIPFLEASNEPSAQLLLVLM